jgi:hypothetical protein
MKNTEGSVLGHLAQGNALTAADRNKLVTKIGKGQSKQRARDITDAVEGQYATQFAAMTPNEQAVVQKAVRDYTLDSTAINDSCRAGNPNANALNIDHAFQIYAGHGFTTQQRVVYRLMTYKPPAVSPYGGNGARTIVAGDLIRDLGFFSSSEHRQFLINGIKNPPVGSRYIKFVIIGQGGINISGGGQYTNTNEQAFLKQMHPKSYRFKTAEAGQAEILFPRGTVLRIESVAVNPDHTHVSASIMHPQPVGGGGVKDSFLGG